MIQVIRKTTTSRSTRKQEARERILEAAARHLCREGIEGAAIAPIMQEAGLTHGTFYAHFSNKDDLAAQALEHAVRSRRDRWIDGGTDRSWGERLKRLAAGYLSRRHRNDPSDGCPFAALASESGRSTSQFRAVHEAELRETLDRICAPFAKGDQTDEQRLDEAIGLLATCVGGLALSRAVEDPELSDRILKACRIVTNAKSEAA